jgi:hypothetical protein
MTHFPGKVGTSGYVSNRLIDSFPGLPSHHYIRRHVGPIPEVLKKAGLAALSHGQMQRCAWERRRAAGCDEYYRGVHWTEAELLRALRQLQKRYGFISANLLDQNVGTPSANYFIKRLGSLAEARVLAKLPDQTRSQITASAWRRKKEGKAIQRQPGLRPKQWYRPDDILARLRRLAKRKVGVSARLIDEDPSLPSWATVAFQFGSLGAAYQLAGLVRLDGTRYRRYGLPAQNNIRRVMARP